MYLPCMYLMFTITYHVYIMYIHVCIMPVHLTISAQDVLILSTKVVDHVNNMGNTCMMEP